jgi:hypothetical protein
MFMDKSGDEKVDTIRDRMRHSLIAGDVNKLKEIVSEAETMGDVLQ